METREFCMSLNPRYDSSDIYKLQIFWSSNLVSLMNFTLVIIYFYYFGSFSSLDSSKLVEWRIPV